MARESVAVVRGSAQASALLGGGRRPLLEALAEPDSAAGLARRLGVPRQRINYHLRLLEREGLVEPVEERRKGNCVERVVRATAQAYLISPEALGAIGVPSGQPGDRASSSTLMAAAARAIHQVGALEARAERAGKRLATLTLDTELRFATAESRAAFAEELVTLVGRLAAKYHDDRAPRGRRFRLVALVHPVPAREETVA